MSATRTQIYLTAEQRAALDERARVEHKTMAQVVRDAVTSYLTGDVRDDDRDQVLADTFGACPDFGTAQIPSRDEWDRGPARTHA